MARTRAETNAYARGYAAGRRGAWPDYHPPKPPDAVAAEIMQAAIRLAEHVASWCGAFGDDDEFSKEMRPLMEAVDLANAKVTKWLESPVSESANQEKP